MPEDMRLQLCKFKNCIKINLIFINNEMKVRKTEIQISYLSKILASFRTFPRLMYASKNWGSNVTAFSK